VSSIPSFITSYFVNSVWEVALIGGAGWLVSRLLRTLGPQAEHIAWVSTLVLAVVTPALPVFHWVLKLLSMPHEGMRILPLCRGRDDHH
jgi:predicted permease